MLNKAEIKRLIKERGLVTDYIDLDIQLTPNGFDLTVNSLFEFDAQGAIDFSNKERVVPEGKELLPVKDSPQEKFDWWHLKRGAYKAVSNEIINLPNDLIAIAFPRSSLLRIGAFTQTAVWDAGFKGRSEFILAVENPKGIRLKQNARVIQVMFMRINETEGYQGIYQHNFK